MMDSVDFPFKVSAGDQLSSWRDLHLVFLARLAFLAIAWRSRPWTHSCSPLSDGQNNLVGVGKRVNDLRLDVNANF